MSKFIRNNWGWVLVALSVAFIFITIFLQPALDTRPQEVISEKNSKIQSTASSEAVSAEMSSVVGNQPFALASNGPLAAQMNESTDLRSFALRARNSPLAGGLYYEQLAVEFCRNTKEESNSSSTLPSSKIIDHKNATQRDRALNKLNQLCRSFIPEELDARRFIDGAYRQFAKESKDPAIRIRDGLLKAHMSGDFSAMREFTREAIELRDPYILSKMPVTRGGDVAVFQGKKYTEEDMTVYTNALGLAACDLIGRCEQPDLEVIWVCASQGLCENSQESLRLRLLRESGISNAKIPQMMELRSRMKNAILLGDVDSFFFEK